MNAQQRLANNERLQAAFRQLKADPSATPDQWDALGVDYFAAGYVLNAGVCFNQANECRFPVAVETEPTYATN